MDNSVIQANYNDYDPASPIVEILRLGLRHAVIEGLAIPGASLIECDLRHAVLFDSDLRCVEFVRCKLEGLELRDCHVHGVSVRDGDIQSIRFVQCEHRPFLASKTRDAG